MIENRKYLLNIILMALAFPLGIETANSQAPYPKSTFISEVQFSEFVIDSVTSGDQWATTWADDGCLYSAWGDGTGFGYRGGWNDRWMTYMGVARVDGTPPMHTGANVWGGYEPESQENALYRQRVTPAENRKPIHGFICIDGKFYMYASVEITGQNWQTCELFTSNDHGRTWHDEGILFNEPFRMFADVSVIQYGQDYTGVPSRHEKYVYLYGRRFYDYSSALVLARVPKDRLLERDAYEFFTGAVDELSWAKEITKAGTVFHDPNGISWGAYCIYNMALQRYILILKHPPFFGKFNDPVGFGIFEAPEPWGPWATVTYTNRIAELIPGMEAGISFTIPQKWIQNKGKSMWMIFSGRPPSPMYSFNLVRLELTVNR